MATAYTVLLGRGRGSTDGDLELFHVGSERAVIVRDLVIANTGTVAGIVHVYVRTGESNFHLGLFPLEPLETTHLELRQRLAAGDVLRAYSNADDWNLSVTGYLLGLEPAEVQQLPA